MSCTWKLEYHLSDDNLSNWWFGFFVFSFNRTGKNASERKKHQETEQKVSPEESGRLQDSC